MAVYHGFFEQLMRASFMIVKKYTKMMGIFDFVLRRLLAKLLSSVVDTLLVGDYDMT